VRGRRTNSSHSSIILSLDFGRTPLHDACWTPEPNFDIVELILSNDKRLLNLVDCRGSSPLSYIKRSHWGAWVAFLHQNVNRFWPARDLKKHAVEPQPPFDLGPPNLRPIPDPENALSLDIAQLVASGQLSPENARLVYSSDEAITGKEHPKSQSQSLKSGRITLPLDISPVASI
jgi:hypothetical protein